MPSFEAPKEVAQRLLKTAGIKKAPINVEDLAVQVGAIVSFEPFKEELSGVLIKEKKRIVIGVNSSHPKTRQRFTIAHEIGHLQLKHQGEIFVDQTVMRRDDRSSQAVDRQEIEANRFAAELLMPEDFILESVKRLQDSKVSDTASELIAELAQEFQVSPQAMEYRLTNLGIFMPQ
jgi:Zn-dependent peptidase ImmA (M78 family)